MTAQNDLDRTLGAWFDGDAIAPPPEPLAHVIESTRTIRPRPALTARIGSRWVGARSTSGPWIGSAGLRPVTVVALVALLAIALLGAVLLAGSRLIAPKTPLDSDVAIFVRRDDGAEPGVSIVAVRPDGSEVLVRRVTDSSVPGLGVSSDYSTVSESGWLALEVVGKPHPSIGNRGINTSEKPWPMLLVDLADRQAEPWVVDQASLGGIGPRWGPTGLVAANAGAVLGSFVVIADPETRTTRMVSMPVGLVGGGPSIIWTADGSGIVGSTESGAFDTIPVDGGDPRPDVGEVFDPRGAYGSGLAELQICSPGAGCPGGDDGRIERVERDSSARTIWQQEGNDRALAAGFGSGADEYWLSVDHDQGRQVALIHLHDGRQDTVATVNRDAAWQYVGAPTEAADGSSLMVWIGVGDKPAAILVPLNGAPPTFHTGNFAGFVDRAAAAAFVSGEPGTPAQTLPAAGEAYALPSLDELIAAELRLNPGRTVLGKASHDAVDGETDRRTFEVPRDRPGAGEGYLDCLGPSSVTITSGAQSTTSPCLSAGSYGFTTDGTGPITVSASGDTSWRVVMYSSPSPVEGATEPPTPTTTTAPTVTAKPAS